ncbi:hypothetical protein [Thalassotalea fusca]
MEHATSLHDFFTEQLNQLSKVIRSGYQSSSLTLPILEPLNIEREITGEIASDNTIVQVSFEHPTLSGLASLESKSQVRLCLSERTIFLRLTFTELTLSSDNFQLKGNSIPLLFTHQLDSNGKFSVSARNVSLQLTIALNISEQHPHLEYQMAQSEIKALDFHVKDNLLLSNLLPFFKEQIEKLAAKRVGKLLCYYLNDKFQQVCQHQAMLLSQLTKLSQLKQHQVQCSETTEPPKLLQGLDGISQLSIPMFWQIPCVDPNKTPHIELNDLIEQAETGDLILFAGSQPYSLRIRRFTQSRYSHVAIVIKEPEFNDGNPCVWQATSSEHAGVLRQNKVQMGIQLNNLKSALADYSNKDDGAVISYRKAMHTDTSRAIMRDNWPEVRKLILANDGKPYTNDMDGLYVMGLMEIDNPNKEDYFCAGLVAQTLMDMALLETTIVQYQYAPRDFSELQNALPLAQPMNYGPETIIDGVYR